MQAQVEVDATHASCEAWLRVQRKSCRPARKARELLFACMPRKKHWHNPAAEIIIQTSKPNKSSISNKVDESVKLAEPGAAPDGAPQSMIVPQILLVDDNPIQAEARKAILSRVGAEVLVAASAREALSVLEDDSRRSAVAVMVTDHLMPGMNGPELVAQVRVILPSLPILVLSGLPDAEEEYAEGSVLFRVKPFPPAELIRLVRHMLGNLALRTA